MFFFFFSSRRRHTRCSRDWSSDVCSSDLYVTHTPGIFKRTSPSNGGGMLAYLMSNPSDSVYIDETSFVILEPPPVGTQIDSVFGVLQERNTDGINAFIIAPRNTTSPSSSNPNPNDL